MVIFVNYIATAIAESCVAIDYFMVNFRFYSTKTHYTVYVICTQMSIDLSYVVVLLCGLYTSLLSMFMEQISGGHQLFSNFVHSAWNLKSIKWLLCASKKCYKIPIQYINGECMYKHAYS